MRKTMLMCAVISIAGCGDGQPRAAQSESAAKTTQTASTCPAEARSVVEQLGSRMRVVSLLAPDSVVKRELRDAYASLVTNELLASWATKPSVAPGRRVSNPWPARVEISSVEAESSYCAVKGSVVYVTTSDTTTAVERRAVTMRVIDEAGWRVSAYDESPAVAAATDVTASGPADVVRRYYAAIQAGKFDAAYAMWSRDGQASGQTRAAFASGFAETERVRATISDSVRLEGAAGSQYATVPVAIDATLKNGKTQRFEGDYTLRRAMVDGATPEQRTWHIYAAHLRQD